MEITFFQRNNAFYSFFLSIAFLALPFRLSAQQQSWVTKSSDGFIPRAGHCSCVVDGKIYVIGGISLDAPFIGIHNYVQVYDPESDSWSSIPPIGSFSLRYQATASVIDGKIYIIDGRSLSSSLPDPMTIDVFDPSTYIWTTLVTTGKQLSFTRHAHTASVVDGKIYVIGRSNNDLISNGSIVNDLQIFDPSTNTWSTPEIKGTAISRVGASSAVISGKIYIIGGDSVYPSGIFKSPSINRIDVFDPNTSSWSTPIVTGNFKCRHYFASAVLDGKIYVIGGEDSTGLISQVDVFDIASNTWNSSIITGTYTPRDFLTVNAINGHIYAFGGTGAKLGSNLFPYYITANNANEEFTPILDEVKSNTNSDSIALFPNPTTGLIAIYNLPDNIQHISIINIIGQKVIDIAKPETSNIQFDLSNFPPGIYHAKFEMGNSVIIKKIVRQ